MFIPTLLSSLISRGSIPGVARLLLTRVSNSSSFVRPYGEKQDLCCELPEARCEKCIVSADSDNAFFVGADRRRNALSESAETMHNSTHWSRAPVDSGSKATAYIESYDAPGTEKSYPQPQWSPKPPI